MIVDWQLARATKFVHALPRRLHLVIRIVARDHTFAILDGVQAGELGHARSLGYLVRLFVRRVACPTLHDSILQVLLRQVLSMVRSVAFDFVDAALARTFLHTTSSCCGEWELE